MSIQLDGDDSLSVMIFQDSLFVTYADIQVKFLVKCTEPDQCIWP